MELRYNQWIARREVEGPKKINQVHADAKRDDANRARAAAGAPGMRGRGDYNRGPSNLDSYGGPPQRCYSLLMLLICCIATVNALVKLVPALPGFQRGHAIHDRCVPAALLDPV